MSSCSVVFVEAAVLAIYK